MIRKRSEDAPSTTFPGINDKVVQEGILNSDATKVTLPTEFDGLEDGSGSIFDGTEFLTSDSNPLYDIPEHPYGVGSSVASDYADFTGTQEKFSPTSNQANFETANSIFNPPPNKNIIRNPNEETQPYRGIYIDPRTVPEINEVQSNTVYPPTMPAGYEKGNNINLLTTTDKEYIPDVPIKTTGWSDEEYQEMLRNAIFVNLEKPKPAPSGMSTLPIARADMDAWESGDEQGQFMYGELEKEALKNMAGTGYLGIQDTPIQPSYSSRIETEPQLGQINAAMSGTSPGWGNSRIWENPPEPTAEVALPNDNLINLVHSQTPRIDAQEASYMGQEDPSLNILMHKMASGMDGLIDYAPGTSGAIDQIVANTLLQQQAVQPVAEHPGITAKKNLAAKHSAAQTQAKAVAQKKVYQKQYEQLKKAGAPVRRSGNRYGFGF